MKKINRRKEFFLPIKAAPRGLLVLTIRAMAMAFYSTYTVVLLEKATSAIEASDIDAFNKVVVLLAVLFLVHYLLKILYKPHNFRIIRDMGNFLNERYLSKFLQANNNDTEKMGTGRMISILQKGLRTRVSVLIDIFRVGSLQLLTVLFSLYILATKSLEFFFLGLGVVIVLIPWVSFFSKKAVKRRRKAKNSNVELSRMMVRWIMSKFEIQQQDKYDYEIQRRKKLNNTWFINKFTEKRRQAIAYDTVVLGSEVLLIAVTVIVGLGVIRGGYSFADFVLVTGLTITLKNTIFNLQMHVRKIMDQFVDIEKLRDTFEQFGAMRGFSTGKKFDMKNGNISIKQMTYGYYDEKLFNNFNLEIRGGQKTAFVGPSGGGKSTLIKLIAGYLSADEGDIYVDGQGLKNARLKTYFKHVGYLTQEPSIFDGTVRENLTYAIELKKIPQKQIDDAIKHAKCEFIYDLKDGLDSEIGERGIRLSGGQRQRLAIAKIFLKDPEIVLLDEPTSALDSFSEEAVTEAMNNLFQDRTVIVIAHRLQTVKSADDIIVLDKGKIIERGTHKELVKQKGHYAKMLELQSGF